MARIGIADAAPGVALDARLWTRAGAAAALPARPADGHKGTFGHALLVAGSEGKTGAAALCAEGAARVGAGLVTLACPAGLNDILEAKVTEAMTAPLPDTGARQFAAAAEDGIVALAATRSAVGLGPGIGRARETTGLVRALAKRIEVPLAIDADGVVAFAGELAAAARAARAHRAHAASGRGGRAARREGGADQRRPRRLRARDRAAHRRRRAAQGRGHRDRGARRRADREPDRRARARDRAAPATCCSAW